ncbi:MAG: TIGR04563 family protein [Sandaracinaceae bacterium]|jgi:uncharacterized small protein (TIGR04563 family)|nr:TIGR04563 family protein [Sandaracinaceae bacterium]
MSDPRKISVYFPGPMIRELRRESIRLERTVSWLVQRCVRIGLEELKKMPSINDPDVDLSDEAMDELDEDTKTHESKAGSRAAKG